MPSIVRAHTELLRYVSASPVGGSGVASVDVLIVELQSDDGVAGLGFSYVLGGSDELPLAAAQALLDRFVRDVALDHPIALWRRIAASFNRTGGGPYRTALAAIDVARWDLYANALDAPLGVAMGGSPRPVPVYGSGGYTPFQSPDESASVARAHRERGLRAVKIRVAGTAADAPRLAAVRGALDDAIPLMIDANERCTLASAQRLLRVAADAGALFVEEPLPAAAIAGYRALARNAPVPIATGEHLDASGATTYVLDGLCSVMQPDLAAMGGLTPALHVAQRAEAAGVEIAPHFLPGLFVHLAAAAPNVTWLEEFPLLEPLFDGWPPLGRDGTMVLGQAAGHGLRLAAGAREQHLIASSSP
jgi:L-alanine-DL-glutamate epimerase-like enolase superfamily enzyme